MRLVCNIILFVFANAVFAETQTTDVDRLTELLASGQTSQASIRQMEDLHQSTQTPSVAIKTAYVLAQSPASWLQQKPSVYAEFFLKKDSCVKAEDCFSLYRIAGDGHFESLRFSKASFWYEKGIADTKVDPKDREYLVYKNAWAYLNAKNPQKAFFILADWLNTHPSMLLREPMMTDLGRIYGEMVFVKNKDASAMLNRLKTTQPQDAKVLLEGVLKAFSRISSGNKGRELLYSILLRNSWSQEGLELLFTSQVFKETTPCEVMLAEPFVAKNQRSDVRWEPFLQKCAVFLSESGKKIKSQEFSRLAKWMGEVPMSLMGEWGRAKMLLLSGDSFQGCIQFSQMALQVLSSENSWKTSWLQDAINSCANLSEGAEFTKMIQAQRDILQKQNLLSAITQSSKVALPLKIELLKAWMTSDSQAALQEMSVVLADQPIKSRKSVLEQLCPVSEKSCGPLWWNILRGEELNENTLSQMVQAWDSIKNNLLNDEKQKSQFAAALMTSGVSLGSTSDDFLEQIQQVREAFETGAELRLKADFSQMPAAQDALVLQGLGQPPQDMPEVLNEELITSLQKFQETANEFKKRVWSHGGLKKRAQQKIAQWAVYWQKQIALRKAKGAEKQEWKQVAGLLKKWEKM